MISYSIAGRIESGIAPSAVWSATFDRYPRFPEAIRVTATGQVERVRIYVDGAVVAEQLGDAGDRRMVLYAEAVIPPPADESAPDTLGAGEVVDPSTR